MCSRPPPHATPFPNLSFPPPIPSLQVVKGQTYTAKVNDTPYNVTFDELHVLKKAKINLLIAVKGGYFFIAKTDNEKPEQSIPAAAASLAIGFYWAVGPDAA